MAQAKQHAHDWLNDHGDYLYRFALARLRDPHQAEDAVQETLVAAMQGQPFAGKSAARTWLTGILKHKIIDLMRKQMREQATDNLGEESGSADSSFPAEPGMDEFFAGDDRHWADSPQSWAMPDGQLEQKQFLQILQTCLDRLPKKLAMLFTLRDIQEEDNETICKEMGVSTTNAWVMLYRARMSLRKCLEIHWLEIY